MKITVLLITMCIGSLMASTAHSQTQNVNLSVNNLTLRQVFHQIEKQSNYSFFYNDQFTDLDKIVSVSAKSKPLNEILMNLFAETDLTFKMMDNNFIVITPKVVAAIQNVSGQITTKKGIPLTGVAIQIKGTNKKTVTDSNGNYSIQVPDKSNTLMFSYIGMIKQEIEINGRTIINVVMEEEISSLDEVVVVGYGTSKKKDMTGSVSRIGAKEIANSAMGATVQSMLQGKAAGVNVMVASASPTSPVSIVIRGASSLSGDNQPLWVIDGVPQYNAGTSGNITNTLYNLNLNDVESIDVLKDASATAIYGSRGASGVVIVTTKHGKEGMKPVIEFSSQYGIQHIDNNKIQILDRAQYIAFSKAAVKEGIMTVGGLDYFTRKYIDETKFNAKFAKTSNVTKDKITDDLFLPNAFQNGNTDWWKLMTQDAVTQDYSLSLRGGTKQTSYFTSAFIKDQDGIVIKSKSKTYGLRFNFESSLRDVLKLGVSVNGSFRKTSTKDALVSTIMKMRPDVPAYNANGTINKIDTYLTNPLLELENRNDGIGKSASATMYMEYDITKFLKLRTAGTIDYSLSKTDNFSKSKYDGDLNSRSLSYSESNTYVWENTLNFFKTIGKHDLNVMTGFSMEKSSYEGMRATGQSFPDEEVLINLSSAAIRQSMSSNSGASTLMSAFTRANYKYDNKYLLTATLREDGSSKFGPDKRWGIFPSAALAWIISEEGFMKGVKNQVSYLKLRTSVGRTGSQNLGNYDWRTLMGSQSYNGSPGIVPASLGNDILQWESQKQVDLGLDFGLFRDRVRGTFGWYQKEVDNLLYNDPVPLSSSFSSVQQNIASIRNRGLEFDVRVDLWKGKDYTWEFNFNIAHNTGTLEKLNSSAQFYGGGSYDQFKIPIGGKLGQFYGYKYAGRLFQTREEVIALKPLLTTGYLDYYRDSYENAGDLYVIDLNGDGKITTDDRTNLGSANPDVYGGFGSTFTWESLRLDAAFSYALGGKRLLDLEARSAGDPNVYNTSTMVNDSWTMKGSAGGFPRVTYYGWGGNNIITDRYLHNASFLRLNAVSLSYRLPEKWFKGGIFDTMELSFQASNLFTITKYPGFDPQGNFSTSGIAFTGTGMDYSTYPQAKTYNFGLKFILK